MIVGITRPIASGKSVLAGIFAENGFIRLTLSGEVRGELEKRGRQIERAALQDLGNEMRSKYGNGFWAKRLIAKMAMEKNYVIEGIRNPGEVEEFRRLGNFILIGVDAPVEKRIEWIKSRNKDSDPKTLEGVKAMDARDRGVGEAEHGQQSEACFELADNYIMNDTSLDNLREKAVEIVQQMGE